MSVFRPDRTYYRRRHAWVATKAQVQAFAVSATLDGALQRQGIAAQTTLEAALQRQGLVAQATLEVAVQQQALIATAAMDAGAQAVGLSINTTLESALQKFGAVSSDLSAAIQQLRMAAATLDVALKAQDLSVASSLDAQIQAIIENTIQVTFDGAIRLQDNLASAVADAAVQQARTAATTIDAALKSLGIETSADLDAAIRKMLTTAGTIDAAVQAGSLTTLATLDAVVSVGGPAISASIDAAIRAVQTITATLDAVVSELGSILPVNEIVTAASNLTDGTNTPAMIIAHLETEDDNWWTAVDPKLDTDTGWLRFPTPGGTPAGQQRFEFEVRKTAGNVNPTFDVLIREGTGSPTTLRSAVIVDNGTSQIRQAMWDASLITNKADVQVRLVGHRSGS